jgi:tetratricopeptide (TPR) repeat protein
MRKRQPQLLAAGLIFLAGLLPVLGFTPFLFQRFSGVADHYLYLSMLGVALTASVVVAQNRHLVTTILATVVLVGLAMLSVHQSGFWHDDLTLWRHNVQINPQSGLAQLNLGSAYYRAGDMQSAERCYREALRIDPNDAAAHDNLAMVLITTGRRDEAVQHTDRVLEINRTRAKP